MTIQSILRKKIESKLNNPRLFIFQLFTETIFDKYVSKKYSKSLILFFLSTQMAIPAMLYNKDTLIPSYRKLIIDAGTDSMWKGNDKSYLTNKSNICKEYHEHSTSCIKVL